MELREIQAELKKVFPPQDHKIRDLPGGGQWVYLPWQKIRDRLDEVYPAWIVDYSEVQYLGNDAICRCGITIEGVRKEAIASVPIEILSSKGRDMSRGSAADRLHAEAIKNAAEVWGVGRYLDDQEFTAKYLWDNLGYLDDKAQGEMQKLIMQFKGVWRETPKKPPIKDNHSILHAMTDTEPPKQGVISQKQAGRLYAIAKNNNFTDEEIKAVLQQYGFNSSKEIAPTKYKEIVAQFENPKQLQPQIDRELLRKEIGSLIKRKNLTPEQAQDICFQEFKVRESAKLTDEQLLRLRDRFSLFTGV